VWIFQKPSPSDNNFDIQRKIQIKSSKIILECNETTKGKAKKKEKKIHEEEKLDGYVTKGSFTL
jgi:predicted translin family RNA/ssDNA-binding protein